MTLEQELRANTTALHRNTNEVAALKVETKAYRESTEKSVNFLQDLVNRFVKHEQEIQKKWQAAAIKWGGWIAAGIIGIFEGYRLIQGGL